MIFNWVSQVKYNLIPNFVFKKICKLILEFDISFHMRVFSPLNMRKASDSPIFMVLFHQYFDFLSLPYLMSLLCDLEFYRSSHFVTEFLFFLMEVLFWHISCGDHLDLAGIY